MTKEEIKANEEANRLIDIFGNRRLAAKCVDEIIKEVILFKQYSMGCGLAMEQLDFWQSVKQILEAK